MTIKLFILAGVVLVIGTIILVILSRGRRKKPEPRRSPLAPGPKRRNWLVGETGDVKDKFYHVGSRTVTMGRAVSNLIQITDRDSSRVHCQFIPSPVGLQVKDMESGNGTFVNDEQIKVHVLQEGDRVKVGVTVFRYIAEGNFKDAVLNSGRSVSKRQSRPTEMAGAMSIDAILSNALGAHDNDPERAAASLKMEIGKFRAACESQGIDLKG